MILGLLSGHGLASAATGSITASSATIGTVAGAIAYASTFDWVKAHILPVAAFGKARIPDMTGVPDLRLASGADGGGPGAFYG